MSLTASTPIIDVTGPEPVEHARPRPAALGRRPRHAPEGVPGGHVQLGCALIVGRRTASTDRKTSLNEALREAEVGA